MLHDPETIRSLLKTNSAGIGLEHEKTFFIKEKANCRSIHNDSQIDKPLLLPFSSLPHQARRSGICDARSSNVLTDRKQSGIMCLGDVGGAA
jgi:hypothetical protein